MTPMDRFEPVDVDDAVTGLTQRWDNGVSTVVLGRSDESSAVASDTSVVSLRRLNRIVRVDVANSAVVAEAGVPIGALREAIEAAGLWCPALRWLPRDESIGAAVAGGHGRRSRRYGAVVDYLLGSRFIAPAVGLTRHGGLAIKNATGYNLTCIVAGSRGNLAVIVEVILRLNPLPRHRLALSGRSSDGPRAWTTALGIARSSLQKPEEARLGRTLASVEAWAELDASETSILVEVDDVDRETNHDVFDEVDRMLTTGGLDARSVDEWPPRLSPALFTTRRFACDPTNVGDTAQSLVSSSRKNGNGFVLAELTGGALELSLDRKADVKDDVDWQPSSSRSVGAVGEFREAIKAAFDPLGLLREAWDRTVSNDPSS